MAQARLGIVIVSALLVSGCGSSSPTTPDSPTPGATSPSGTWKGAFQITSCTGVTDIGACQTAPETFVLRLGSDGGVLQIDTRIWSDAPPLAVNVSVRPGAGTTMVSGSSAASRNLDAQLTLTDVGTGLQGTVQYSVDGIGGRLAKQGRVLFANRDATVYPARFEGQWVGFVTRTQCAGECSDGDAVLRVGNVRLLLSQAGSAISGALNGHDLTGTATGSNLSASGRFAVAPTACRRQFDSGMTCLLEMNVSATADSLDRLHGSITYRVEGVDDRGRPFALSASGTLDGLARWP
jgi:hypothetical protein